MVMRVGIIGLKNSKRVKATIFKRKGGVVHGQKSHAEV